MAPKIRVLIVDDHTTVIEDVSLMLSIADDFEVVGKATTGREGFMLAGKVRPDVILMDVMMPTVDGIATGRAILRVLPQTKIILMSGEMQADYLWKRVLPQASGFMVKPFTVDLLHKAIRDAYFSDSSL